MKLRHLLIETTEEDRAILSLSLAIDKLLRTKYLDHDEIDYYSESDSIGKIGELFDTPLEVMNQVTLLLVNDYHMDNVMGSNNYLGYWDPNTNELAINREYIGVRNLRPTVTHELRHALDDLKSGHAANKSHRYTTPNKKITADNLYGDGIGYLSEPAEINARFLEALTSTVMHLHKQIRQKGIKGQTKDKMMSDALKILDAQLASRHVSTMFNKDTKHRAYRRLLIRAHDMLDKEIDYLLNKFKNML